MTQCSAVGPPHTYVIPETPKPKFASGTAPLNPIDGPTFRAIRDALGLTTLDFATYLQVGHRTVQRWDRHGLPDWAAYELEALCAFSDLWVDRLSRGAHLALYPERTVEGRRTSGWRVLSDGSVLPESWWRCIVGRAAILNPTLAIGYAA